MTIFGIHVCADELNQAVALLPTIQHTISTAVSGVCRVCRRIICRCLG